jgi:hypothetical protein
VDKFESVLDCDALGDLAYALFNLGGFQRVFKPPLLKKSCSRTKEKVGANPLTRAPRSDQEADYTGWLKVEASDRQAQAQGGSGRAGGDCPQKETKPRLLSTAVYWRAARRTRRRADLVGIRPLAICALALAQEVLLVKTAQIFCVRYLRC